MSLNKETMNPHLAELNPDFLYHLGLDSSMDLKGMFGDVKYVCMGGSPERAEAFAKKTAEDLGIKVPEGGIEPIGKTERFSLYKVGPVISVSHGMGMPSMSILLNEIAKLLFYAGVPDPVFMRIGTSGGIGVEPGMVVVTDKALNEELLPHHKKVILGLEHKFPTELDKGLIKEIIDVRGDVEAVVGNTIGTDDFYEGQARMDGALPPLFTERQQRAFLELAYAQGARNFEMEAPEFAAFCIRAGIRCAVMCVALLNRLKGDQVTSTREELAAFSDNAQTMALRYIESDMVKATKMA